MGIFERLKKILKNKPIINETNLARIDTDLVFIPSFKKLSKDDQEKVLNYIKEININDLDSLVNYAKELSEEANFDTEILLRLYYKLIDENEVNEDNEDNEDIIYDKYKTIISINELNLCKNDLEKLKNEGILRVVSLEEVLKKELSRKLTFLGMFSKVEKNKRENDINSLKYAIERTKIVIKVIEQLISTVNNSVSNNTLKVKRENVFLSLTDEKESKEILNELVNETKELIKRFLPLYENELVFDIENIDSCLFNISVAKRLLDLYAYKHKNEMEKINEKVIELTNQNKTTEDKEDLLKIIKEIELIYIVFKSYLKEEYLLNFYQLKFDVLCLDLSKDKESLFKNIKDKKELLFYKKIIELKLDKILTGNNKYLEKVFDKNTGKAIELIRDIIKKEVGNYSGENILNNRRVLAFILAFDQEDGFEKFITKNYFNKNDLVYELNDGIFCWNDELPLKTIILLEDVAKNIFNPLKNITPWVKFLKYIDTYQRINVFFHFLYSELELPEGIRKFSDYVYDYTSNQYERLMSIGNESIFKKRVILSPSSLKIIGDKAFMMFENLTKIKLNEGLEIIEDSAFSWCENLQEISFPSSLKEIGMYIFDGSKNLQKIIVSPHKIDVEAPPFYELPSIKKQINLVISGIDIEDGCLQNWLRYNLRQIKSIEIMDDDIIAIHYDIKNDNTEEIINEVNKKLDEYKRNNKSNKVKKLSL